MANPVAGKAAGQESEARRKAREAEARRARETPEERAKRKAREAEFLAMKAKESPEDRAKRKAEEAAMLAKRARDMPEGRHKKRAEEVALEAAKKAELSKAEALKAKAGAKRKAEEINAGSLKKQAVENSNSQQEDSGVKSGTTSAGIASPALSSGVGSPSPTVVTSNASQFFAGGLYDDIPDADAEKDALAAQMAQAVEKKRPAQPQINYTPDRSKVIFLDIDGVLRPLASLGFQMSSLMMNGEAVPLVDAESEFLGSAMSSLRMILEATGAILVLSSEWRRHPALRDGVDSNLKHRGLPQVHSDTPLHQLERFGDPLKSFALRRAREIGEYLTTAPLVKRWVALDDIDLSMADDDRRPGQPALGPRLVLTDKGICLTKEDAKKAIALLNGNSGKASGS